MGNLTVSVKGDEYSRLERLLRVIKELHLKMERYGDDVKYKFELISIEDHKGHLTIEANLNIPKTEQELFNEIIERFKSVWEYENELFIDFIIYRNGVLWEKSCDMM